MKNILFIAAFCACLAGSTTSFAQTPIVVYQNDYEGETIGAGFPAWNWTGGSVTHDAVFADYGGNIVVEHRGTVGGSTGAADNRFGSKWDIMLTGNTSTDPAQYTISFDLRNVSGDWDPLALEFWVLTEDPTASNDEGFGGGAANYAIADGWVHVEANLGDLAASGPGWWQGNEWVINKSRWSLEVGMPWPGLEATGPFEQIWLMDNLKIELLPPPTVDLTLVVNKDTGEIRIRNDSASPVSFDYYALSSAQNALDPTGWNSLDDQGFDFGVPTDFGGNGTVDGADLGAWQSAFGVDDGADANSDGSSDGADFLLWQSDLGRVANAADGWIEAGGSSSGRIGELYLEGASSLAPGQEVSLGAAYNTSVFGTADGDIGFEVSTGASTALGVGTVVYVSGGAVAIPEPASMALCLGGFGALAWKRRWSSQAVL